MQNECHITASERLYRLINNGSSASGILPADVFFLVGGEGTLCEVSSAPAAESKHAVGISNISLTPPLPSPLYFFFKSHSPPPPCIFFLFYLLPALYLSLTALSVFFPLPLCRHLGKAIVIYIHVGMLPLSYIPLPNPHYFARSRLVSESHHIQ